MVNLLTEIKDLSLANVEAALPSVRDVNPILLARRKALTITRELLIGNIQLATAPTDTFGGYSVRLNDLPSYTELTTTFDEYRMVQLEITFVPTSNNNFHGQLVTVIDYDTSTAPSNVNDLYQYNSCQKSEPGSVCIRRFTPRSAVALYSGAFSSYGIQTNQWISCDSPGVFHYGLRYYIPAVTGTATNLIVYQVVAKATLQFRNTR